MKASDRNIIAIRKFSSSVFCLAILLCGITSCDKPSETNCETGTVSFSQNVLPILNANCSLSGCHSGTSTKGGLNLSDSIAYQKLLQTGSGYVKPSNPSGSIVIAEMKSSSSPMPPTGNLEACKIETIYKWIEQGALNN